MSWSLGQFGRIDVGRNKSLGDFARALRFYNRFICSNLDVSLMFCYGYSSRPLATARKETASAQGQCGGEGVAEIGGRKGSGGCGGASFFGVLRLRAARSAQDDGRIGGLSLGRERPRGLKPGAWVVRGTRCYSGETNTEVLDSIKPSPE